MSKWVYEPFVQAVTEALDRLQQAGTRHATSGQIKEWIRENKPEALSALEPSWGTSLFQAKNDPTTRIRNAPGFSNKYILVPTAVVGPSSVADASAEGAEPNEAAGTGDVKDSVAEKLAGEEASDVSVSAAKKANAQREAVLYPVLREWLGAKGYSARITSSTKTGGTWGNPDICGLRIAEGYLNQREIELVTVEAKITHYNWRLQFFEAVSHRRFAHRVYFAFAVGARPDEVDIDSVPDAQDLRRYAEEFGVGVLAVFVTSEAMAALLEGDRDAVKSMKLDPEETSVLEVWPAIRRSVQLSATTEFLSQTLKLRDDAALYKFGDDEAG